MGRPSDWEVATKVIAGDIRAVDAASRTIPAELTPDGLIFKPQDGSLIHLSNSATIPRGIPTVQHVAATRPVIQQTIPRVITEPWAIDEAVSN